MGTTAHAESLPDQHAVASAHPLATSAGINILREGGNAFDAAVTVAAVLAVVEPYSSGIGGGGFWLLHRASDEKQVMLDGRERAPLAAHRDMYLDDQGNMIPGASINGALAAGIPGQIAAMTYLQEHYGSFPLSHLLRPAIKIAREGFEVDETYRRLASFRLKALQSSSSAQAIFLRDGQTPTKGTIITQTNLAKTLEAVAQYGKAGFYQGAVAKRLVQGTRNAGGIWTMQDLLDYRVVEREPIHMQWQDMQITSATLPSSGGIVLAQILNMLSQYDWNSLSQIQRTHLLIEAMRRAYRDRAEYLGDPDYISINIEQLTSETYARQLAGDIETDAATPSSSLKEVTTPKTKGSDTTHYSILDKHGNRVSATLSINYPFGSGFVPPGTGVLLNDEMDDFSIHPGKPNVYGLIGAKANAIEPGKRMLSSMSPSFIETENKLALIGTPGGSRIITMVLQAVISLHEGLDAEAIVNRPRIHHQYFPDQVQLEPGLLTQKEKDILEGIGHKLKILQQPFGNMQIIMQDKQTGKVTAASDPRGIGNNIVDLITK